MSRKLTTTSLLVFIVAILVISQAYYSYSEGERSGYVKEFAKKGYVIKTYEGILVQQVNGVFNAESFKFSVNDKEVAKLLLDSIRNNERVNIKYKQKKYIIQAFHGDTEYFITEVEPSK